MICTLSGGPHACGEALAIFGTPGVCFDALKQGWGLFGAETHCLEASE